MEGPKDWVLHPHRCDFCGHATYLRECWRHGSDQVNRHERHEPFPRLVQVQGVQPGTWPDIGRVTTAVLPANRGVSYTLRGHGVTITVSGHENDVFNVARVASDVLTHPVIQGEICVRGSPPTGVGGGNQLPYENQTNIV
ncbi:hypothetical protein JCSMV_gp5 [Johnsongrass chlorotic stripe mosaic virus]|uniref:Silencing suppressor n=1 Tax=Johnsongrass chlorotic stripe mosaic virus TaxID=229149 RepID=Q70P82_9TOMB|nr:hypothetical protein JCSMV_gp5 [Johnsongrass chlorotic stripe mosaic virus]QWC36245.1 silencing suppressor [Johnsongrass chlorotic stripe mosaic virus]CAD89894.1 hypothetical protein [Johnsongrass chlorotic stripe mosaic virus]